MSNIIVMTFDDMETAGKVRSTLKDLERAHKLSLDDSAVVVKDENGKVHVKNQMDRGVKIGVVGGGVIGLLLAGVFFPFAGLIIGAVGGGIVGTLADVGIQGKFVKEVSQEIGNGTSALFIVVREADPATALAVLREFEGELYHTSLDPEAADSLRDALDGRNPASY